MKYTIALAGNPNSGKTTMFNALTGSTQYVGNWPGVTVEKKEGRWKTDKEVTIMDLPGIYSLSPYTLEEVITRQYLLQEKPDAIINIVDAANLERNLYLSTQLLELGIPLLIALNMMDVVKKRGDRINTDILAKELGCPVIETTALKGTGLNEAVQKAVAMARDKQIPLRQSSFSRRVEDVLGMIAADLGSKQPAEQLRWQAIKIYERDPKVLASLPLTDDTQQKFANAILACEEALDDDSESIITNERYEHISALVKRCTTCKQAAGTLTVSDKIDRLVTHRFLGLPIFGVVMFIVYYLTISTIGGWATEWVNEALFGEIIPPAVEGWLAGVGAASWLSSLILDGIIGGVGAVLGFLPQMLVLFLFLAILEDCGYMARVAFIMDRIFRKFGLSGKSFIPMLIGTGCGVPAIMASRTIENERDRRLTITTTTFVPCGAKLPIIALIAGALFDKAGWVAPVSYFVGVAAIIVSGLILKKTRSFAGNPAPFVMELPPYHLPRAKGVVRSIYERGKAFVVKAGTIIFLACGLIWFLSSFNWSMQMVEPGESILAALGKLIAPLFAPLGWGNWQSAVAVITGLVAKENVVGTFGILFGFAETAENGIEFWANLRAALPPLAGFSFLVFNLLCAPCFAAMGAIKREMGNWQWTLFAIGYQTLFAYTIALIIFQLGMLFTGGIFGLGTVVALLLLLLLCYLLFRRNPREKTPLAPQKQAVTD